MKILIAIDEDTCFNTIVQFVTAQEWMAKTEFLVLHVIESSPTVDIDPMFVDERRQAIRLVRKAGIALRDAYKTTHVKEKIEVGSPPEKIREIAKSWHADLVVVGSQGKLSDALFGSVSKETLANCDCSVLVVKHKQAQDKVKLTKPNRKLARVDI